MECGVAALAERLRAQFGIVFRDRATEVKLASPISSSLHVARGDHPPGGPATHERGHTERTYRPENYTSSSAKDESKGKLHTHCAKSCPPRAMVMLSGRLMQLVHVGFKGAGSEMDISSFELSDEIRFDNGIAKPAHAGQDWRGRHAGLEQAEDDATVANLLQVKPSVDLLPSKAMRLATWDDTYLFGAMATAGALQTSKRRLLEYRILSRDVVLVRETPGAAADMTTFPPTHWYAGVLHAELRKQRLARRRWGSSSSPLL